MGWVLSYVSVGLFKLYLSIYLIPLLVSFLLREGVLYILHKTYVKSFGNRARSREDCVSNSLIREHQEDYKMSVA